jgi:predicted DNA-binding transcriptional regulator AlpA
MGNKRVNELPSASLSAYERYQELNTKQVMKLIGAGCRQTVWAYTKQGKLPQPRYINSHRPVWRLGEILDHTHQMLTPASEKEPVFSKNKPAEAETFETDSNLVAKLRKRLRFDR